ncbi:hypothetical protein [Streptomyces sp. G1]|uniref:hypothetical protein n=1 Tax=Streptomyces sp. G1 TaxID=361572 RepID=UPI00203082A6|nr:hypothetical protein [Streptomyces sp. G1]MCM1964827.1 hypothetical protein [Streptomyces sp. G1]
MTILDRSGEIVTPADTLVYVEWTRILDDTSTARVTIHPEGDCCGRLSLVRSWRNKLVIFRDGRPVWEGPILTVEWKLGVVEIVAGDVLAWLDRRVPHQDMDFVDTDLTDIAEWLIEDGFAPDDPGHEVMVVGKTGILGDRSYEEDKDQTGDHLRDLAETGLDYTAVGSTIVLLPEDHTAVVGALTDADMPEGLIVAEDGASLATRWIVHGDEDTDIKGEAGGIDDYYGLLERSLENTSVLDNDSATAAALSRLRSSYPVPAFIDTENVTLSPDAAVDVPLLVPGWCLDVATTRTCRTIAQRLKIVGVKVVEDGDGEKIQVQLAPTGAGTGV